MGAGHPVPERGPVLDRSLLALLLTFWAEPSRMTEPAVAASAVDRHSLPSDVPASLVDAAVFENLREHLARFSDGDWICALQDGGRTATAAEIAMAAPSTLIRFERYAAAAVLQLPLSSGITKAARARGARIMGEEISQFVHGEARLLYAAAAGVDVPDHFRSAVIEGTEEDAAAALIDLGRCVGLCLAETESPFWSAILAFRRQEPIKTRELSLDPAQRASLFKLWERKCRKLPNS